MHSAGLGGVFEAPNQHNHWCRSSGPQQGLQGEETLLLAALLVLQDDTTGSMKDHSPSVS